ncbi:hypothetical protein FSP39_014375 [Pinctada imbricata]|uniref:protein-tyrosine-phosphatase n=1 Tax=Pinctada imbricata TaxID=66713 RepID=A0AA89CCR6_PINIB|nr:hypothetical protein FSP39_014375 [Pinctada imbricata]
MSGICFENVECLGSEEFSECFNNTCQCREGFNLRSNGLCEVIGAPHAERVSADSNWPVIGSLIALLLIICAVALIVILVVIMKKRKKTKEPQYWYRELEARSIYNDKTAFPTKSRAYSGELEGGFMNVPDTKAMLWSRGREDSMIPIVADDEFPDDVIDEIPDISPIPINDFASVYTKKWEDKTLMEEFETLASASSRFPRTVAFHSNNKSKNRNNSYVPFDFNRVKLHRKDDKRDYINASFIKGLQGTCPCYIVTQSPLVDTQNDFWRMIWDTRSTSIVMLDTLSQQESYFPSKTSVPLKFDNITVEAVSCLNMQGFSYRCLRVAKDQYVFINECIMQYLKDHSLGGGLPSETKDGYEAERLHDVDVTVAGCDKDFHMLCGTFEGPGTASERVVLECPKGTIGRYVKLQITKGINNILSICEVKVIGK